MGDNGTSRTDRDKLMAEALWHIDAEAEKRGWDQDPGLFAVMIHRLSDDAAVIELDTIAGWDFCVMHAPNPIVGLTAMVAVHRQLPAPLKRKKFPPETLYGVALVTEVWTLEQPKDAVRDAATQKAIDERRMKDLPNHGESRAIFCVSTRGEMSVLNHERDGIAQAFDQAAGKMTGNIPALLSDLVRAICV